VTDAGTEVRVPYRLLTRDLGTPRQPVQSRTDILRAQWHAGDRVAFAVGSAVLHGTISRVNPRYAHVVCDDDREYRVPYARLTPQEPRAATAPRARQRTDGDLQTIAVRATAWIAAHQLEGWSFQFDHATTRAGCCNYQTQVISLAHAYARVASDADISSWTKIFMYITILILIDTWNIELLLDATSCKKAKMIHEIYARSQS
jgi:hypothetical protein